MIRVDTVVIGAGHSGLAVSRLLSAAGRDHVLLDRGRIAERWRSERWDSLRLLTPNWMTRLPGWDYCGPDPDGYAGAGELVRHLESYAGSFGAPVVTGTTVVEVSRATGSGSARFKIGTDGDTLLARDVVVATGPHGVPQIPAGLTDLPHAVQLVTSRDYRNPTGLAPGGVLVVGASASGVQIADELAAAGRRVILAVGRHTRMPRRYRGMDCFWWLDATGRLARTVDEVRDPLAARRETSLQLIGREDPAVRGDDLDLRSLQARGVRLVGRLSAVVGTTAYFAPDLRCQVVDADQRMHRFLDAVDRHVEEAGLSGEVLVPVRPQPVELDEPATELDLVAEDVGTVVVAAGYRPHHPWLRLPVFDADGSIRQRRGVTDVPGLYIVGQPFQHRRDSGFIGGARHDATFVVDHLLGRGRKKCSLQAVQAAA
jgi:putative flavoprotein involved in K+ transport